MDTLYFFSLIDLAWFHHIFLATSTVPASREASSEPLRGFPWYPHLNEIPVVWEYGKLIN
jgi:hypothetical protein